MPATKLFEKRAYRHTDTYPPSPPSVLTRADEIHQQEPSPLQH